MAKVQLREDPEFTKEYPAKWNCRITAESFSGKRHPVYVTYPKGHLENPFTDKEVEDKFFSLAEPVIGLKRCQSFLDWAWRLEGSWGHRKDVSDPGSLKNIYSVEGMNYPATYQKLMRDDLLRVVTRGCFNRGSSHNLAWIPARNMRE
jgi:hypothetical protein